VQQLLGHKTIRTTMRYSHVHPTELREAVNKLGQKIMPKRPRHFTITSQSVIREVAPKLALSQNESILRRKRLADILGAGSMPQTVKQKQPPSEEQNLTRPPSST
jgi:hypothetical protein